ncbi:MAG: DUF2442 domain-containing protein [Chromatiaceae bacterium]|nr:MAG: DUF2442 domain-containing protein [Chromatiaceae bacterium]
MTPDVVTVKVLSDFQLQAIFADGAVRRFDMKPYLQYPAFAALRDEALFQRAAVRHGTVAWSDDIDLSPDTLYLKGDAAEPAKEPASTAAP